MIDHTLVNMPNLVRPAWALVAVAVWAALAAVAAWAALAAVAAWALDAGEPWAAWPSGPPLT